MVWNRVVFQPGYRYPEGMSELASAPKRQRAPRRGGTAAAVSDDSRQRSSAPAPTHADDLDAAEEAITRRVLLSESSEMARYLQEHLGQKLTAYLAGLKNAKTVGQWTQGRVEPPAITRERLRAAYHATELFLMAYGDRTAQGWFFGANASLNDRAPAAVLREAETPEEMALIAPLARAFVRGAH